jgi:uncharacterized membrane protein YfcA
MKTIKAVIIGLLTGIVNGLFGSGGGSVLVPCMEKFLKTEPHKAHACAIAVILPLSIISALLYMNKIDVDLTSLLAVSVGGIAGGFTGAKLLGKIKTKYLHLIFGIFMVISGVRML